MHFRSIIQDYLLRWNIIKKGEEETIVLHPLTDGFSNHTFKVTSHHQSFVARMPGPVTTGKSPSENEKLGLEFAVQNKLFPTPYFYDVKRPFLLTPFVEGRALLKVPTLFRQDLKDIAQTLRHIHHSTPPMIKSLDLATRILSYQDLAPLNPQRINLEVQDLYDKLTKGRKKTLIHGDIHAKNFLKNEDHLYLLDWEFVAFDDPYWDLGYFLVQENLDHDDEAYFLNEYFSPLKTPTQIAEWKKLAAMMLILWCEIQLTNNYYPNAREDYLAFHFYCQAIVQNQPIPMDRSHFLWS